MNRELMLSNSLGAGNYRVSADLPPNMEIAGLLGSPAEPFDLPSHTSLEHDILVFPTGRIAGTVIGPGDKPFHVTSVSLYRADYYQQGNPGVYGYQGPHGPHEENWRPFEFDHLPAGDYILVFNYADFVERGALIEQQQSAIFNSKIDNYSCLSATMGSTPAARRAGI